MFPRARSFLSSLGFPRTSLITPVGCALPFRSPVSKLRPRKDDENWGIHCSLFSFLVSEPEGRQVPEASWPGWGSLWFGLGYIQAAGDAAWVEGAEWVQEVGDVGK